MTPFSYEKQSSKENTTLIVSGSIKLDDAAFLKDLVMEEFEENKSVVLALSEVDYIGSSGVTALIHLRRVSKDRGLSFSIKEPSKIIMKILKAVNLDKEFFIID